MTNIIFTKATNVVDGAIKKKVFAFMEKLSQSDTMVGLHIEPMRNAIDSRARTGRVDDNFRAVLFRLAGQGAESTYVYVGTWPHDEAIAIARSRRLQVNPINGVAELITESEPSSSLAPTMYEPVAESVTLLSSRGVQLDELTDRVGMDKALATRAMAARSEDDIVALAESAPPWQGMALLDLATGSSVEQVLAALDVEPVEAPPRADDQALIEAMNHPASKMAFAFVHDNDELRKAIEEDSFADWRVFLHPEQRRYVDRDYNGPFRLSGGAGTGKTVVLLHRARRLAQASPHARVVLTTYTLALAENLRRDLLRLDAGAPIASALGEPGIYVTGVDALANAVLKSHPEGMAASTEAVFGERRAVSGPSASPDLWRSALGESGDAMKDAGMFSPAFLASEYQAIVLPNEITTRDQYLAVRRPGRGVALDRAKRDSVWKVVAAYRARMRAQQTADFDEIAAVAAHLLSTGPAGRLADHVLVDEGQDLVPSKWRLLRSLAPEGPNDLFIAEDSHQRIYGQRTVLSRWGIKVVGRSQKLTLNYRTTAQNLAYAVSVLDGGNYQDLEAEVETTRGYRSSRTGPVPERHAFPTFLAELNFIAQLLLEWSAEAPRQPIAVLVRTNGLRDTVVRALGERHVKAATLDKGEPHGTGVSVMTMHKAKGMEFSRVCIVGAGADNLPNRGVMKSAAAYGDESDALLRERSLLYVASTRARDALAITWSGEPSPLLS